MEMGTSAGSVPEMLIITVLRVQLYSTLANALIGQQVAILQYKVEYLDILKKNSDIKGLHYR